MEAEFEVAVIGGGPAGSSLAICLARRGRKVALFEATRFDTDRYGETLPPEIHPVLDWLGMRSALAESIPLASPGIRSCWSSQTPVEIDYLSNPYGTGWAIDRNRFDAALIRIAKAEGVSVFLGQRIKPIAEDGLWRVDPTRARFLVDASGRNGLPGTGEYTRHYDDRLIGIVHSFNGPVRDSKTLIEASQKDGGIPRGFQGRVCWPCSSPIQRTATSLLRSNSIRRHSLPNDSRVVPTPLLPHRQRAVQHTQYPVREELGGHRGQRDVT